MLYLSSNNKKETTIESVYPRPHKDFTKTVDLFKRSREHIKEQLKASIKNGAIQRAYKITTLKRFSAVKLNDLKPILLSEMFVNIIHEGRCLLCRTIEDPFCATTLTTLVEDEAGEIENVSVQCFVHNYDIDTKVLLPRHSVLIIKEPHLKQSPNANEINDFCIRVESPSDIIILTDLDCTEENRKYFMNKWISNYGNNFAETYDQLNKLGNKHFIENNYYEAARCYTKALNQPMLNTKISVDKSEIKKTLSNRSAAFLKLEKYLQAYQDALKSSQIENTDTATTEKAYFRIGKAAYAMRLFKLAAEAFSECLSINSKNKAANLELEETKQRILESETGKYDMKKIIEQARVKYQPRLNVADYVSPDIQVSCVNNDPNFKGIKAKNDIKRNMLLVGSKAASICYDIECVTNRVTTFDNLTRQQKQPFQTQNVANIFYKVANDPILAKEIYKLYAGSDFDRSVELEDCVVDTSRLEAILSLNSFSSGYDDYRVDDGSSSNYLNLNEDRLENENQGIWIYPAYFNHSCVPNTKMEFFSDFMMIYANRDIKKGEELTVSYVSKYRFEFKYRREVCEQFGFECKCRLCEADKADAKLDERQALVASEGNKLSEYLVKQKTSRKKPNVKIVNDFVASLKTMYTKSSQRGDDLKVDLYQPMILQGFYYAQAGNLARAAAISLELFELAKNVQEHIATRCLLDATKAYKFASMNEEVKKCLRILKEYFVGHREYFEYICKIRLDLVEDLENLLAKIKFQE